MAANELYSNSIKVPCDKVWLIKHEKDYVKYTGMSHFHDGYEIGLTLSDDTIYDIDGKSYLAKSGTVTIFTENEIHRSRTAEDILYDRYSIHFSPLFIQDFIINCSGLTDIFINQPEGFENCVVIDDAQKEKLVGLLEKMIVFYQDDSINFQNFKLKLALCEILLYVNDIYTTANNSTPFVKNYKHTEQLGIIIEYIKNNLTGDLRLKALADKFYISQPYINMIFKKSFGITPNNYIVYRRILKAQECLQQGQNVNKACELSGYENNSSFIRTFKNLIGCTPKKYQEKLAEVPLYIPIEKMVSQSFEQLSHSERASALAAQHEAIKKQGQRTDLLNARSDSSTLSPMAQKSNATNATIEIGKQHGLSKDTVARYLRINKLIDNLKKRLDGGELAIRSAVVLSYLSKQQQQIVDDVLFAKPYKVDMKKAGILRSASKAKMLAHEDVERILTELW